jgi:hypothetical protein
MTWTVPASMAAGVGCGCGVDGGEAEGSFAEVPVDSCRGSCKVQSRFLFFMKGLAMRRGGGLRGRLGGMVAQSWIHYQSRRDMVLCFESL